MFKNYVGNRKYKDEEIDFLIDNSEQRAQRPESAKIRYRYLPALIFVCGSSYFLLSLSNSNELLFRAQHIYRYVQQYITNDTSYTIKTEGCTIPAMEPLAPDIKKFVSYPINMSPCPHANHSLLENNRTHIWTTNDDLQYKYYNVTNRKEFQCCYRGLYRPDAVEDVDSNRNDDRIKYKECNNFTDAIKVNDEFVRVTCNFNGKDVYDYFFIFATIKDSNRKPPNNSYNVVMLGIDAVSRLNFHRRMPNTLKFLKTKGVVELLGYNKIDDNSFPNIVPLLMGYKQAEIEKICKPKPDSTFDYCPFIWNWFENAGYYTAFGEGSSSLGTFNYCLRGFLRSPTDYYIHPFIHQAEYKAGENRDFNGHLCMKNKFFFKILLDYIEDLAITLKSSRLFGFFWEITMSHDYLNYPMVMDDHYEKMLKRLDRSKYLDETILILLSDHGIRWGDITHTKQGWLEERLPFVYILIPPSFRANYTSAYNNLKLNSRRFTTPFDMHAMLNDLTDLNKITNKELHVRSMKPYAHNRGISLFLPVPTNRTCASVEINDHWCTCLKSVNVSKSSKEASAAVRYKTNTHLYLLILSVVTRASH